jgi:uncharacterized membrane protein YccF (DUF307 family)
MILKYVHDFPIFKTLQNFPKIGIFGLKTNHLATLLQTAANFVPVIVIPSSASFALTKIKHHPNGRSVIRTDVFFQNVSLTWFGIFGATCFILLGLSLPITGI